MKPISVTAYRNQYTPRQLSPVSPVVLFLIVFSVTVGFALYTNHAWEDWYITFRASKNLAMGNGLVFTPGERLHTFTSPIGTLIPALLSYLVGSNNDDLVLWLFRAIGACLLGASGLLVLRSARQVMRNSLAMLLAVAALAFDAKTVDYSINGMETAFMIFFLSLLVYVLTVPVKYPVFGLALVVAGLMWSRPDSFIYIGAVMAGFVAFNPQSRMARSRVEWLSVFVRAGLLGLALYLPWVIWAWWYYGTPIPNTITAKGLGAPDALTLAKEFILFPFTTLFSIDNSVHKTFSPAYMALGGWVSAIPLISKLFTFVSILYWVLPFASRSVRAWSLAAYLGHFYLSHVMPICFPWYVPSVGFLSIWALSLAFNGLLSWVSIRRPRFVPLLKAFAGSVVAFQLVVLLCVAYQMRIQQQTIEVANRKAIGTWLRSNARPGSTVFLECLGYIGFYSELKMYDYPGLSSKEMVAARKVLGSNDYNKLITYLKPDFLVVRPTDGINAAVLNQYREMKRFDRSDEVRSYAFLPGRGYLQYDQVFTIYGRKEASALVSD
ncbi:hypothetical protein [Fibrella forsythiae]|uniref:Glycosyltransferase RgtA/B/C/D-like domain-containing protein n=1 Tax=Fibrella forsythiae TaxID=2817061 RepID=A0ABS3JF71_9BACT|nr:hypothetical protein [Fibrella forsythiae]MBO0948654.1 hypothetical protein [Fibrella forsythiae]